MIFSTTKINDISMIWQIKLNACISLITGSDRTMKYKLRFNKCQIPMMIEMLQNKLKYLSFSFLYRTGSVNPCVRFWRVNTRQPSCNSVYLTNSYACRIPLVTWHLNCENSICISKLMIVIDKVHSMYWWHYWPWYVSYVTPYAEWK